jgi:hypothetical protein
VRELKICGREFDQAHTAAVFDATGAPLDTRVLQRRARWRKVGNVMVIVGVIGFIGSIVAAVAASFAMQGQPQPTDLSQVTPDELRASIVLTVVLAASPMLILFGWLARQKQ